MKNHLKQFLFFLSFLFLIFNAKSQDFSTVVDSAFLKLNERPPLEKLYLHLDRSHYSSGSTIWFKGYLRAATGLTPFAWSNFIYVELFDKSETLISRTKIKQQDGIFAGNIKLRTDLPKGEYILRGYTTWMLNGDEDFLFRKTIPIENYQPSKVVSRISYKTKNEDKTTAQIIFSNKTGEAIAKTTVLCSVEVNDQKIETFKRRTNAYGEIVFDFTRNNRPHKNQFIEVSFEDSPTEYSTKFFCEADSIDDFDVQFFPEGGQLIQGKENKVAFKAIANDGYSTDVSGYIVRNQMDTVLSFKSEYLGMGAFQLTPQEGDTFRAIVNNKDGRLASIDLPTICSQGVALSVTGIGDFLQLSIRASGNNLPKPFYIVAHSGEHLVFVQRVEKLHYTIPLDLLPHGIIDFVLVDGNRKAVSSRLAFIKKEALAKVSVQANKENYARREEVVLDINLQTKDTLARTADFSLAVTDNLVVEMDSFADNIQSNLLLTSELKGHVEQAAAYFKDTSDTTNYYLDLLMMTQGWQRFNFDNLINDRMEQPKHYIELGQTISGKYERTLLGKNKGVRITAFAVDPFVLGETVSDDNGRFLMDGLDFPDSTVFTIQSQRYTKITQQPAGFFHLDKEVFPTFSTNGFVSAQKKNKPSLLSENARERVYYEGEGRMIVLDEFVVTATDKSKNDYMDYGISSKILDADELEKRFPGQMVDFVVSTLPGVFEQNRNIYVHGEKTPAEIYLDEMEADLALLSTIGADEIAKIILITGPTAAIYSRSGGMGGVIKIELKDASQMFSSLPGVEKFMPLGYQKPVEFYVPKYEIDSVRLAKQPDMRSTIYWKPDVKMDSTGMAKVKFFTADPNTDYTYILEGITNRGEICRFVGKLNRKPEL